MKPTLLVLAAGMGSRYGGLKQLDGVGPNGEPILEYSAYDALRAGYGKLVFVIRPDFAEAFEAQVARKFAAHIPVSYVFQNLSDLPDGFSLPPERQKPWGTGHAILAAESEIQEPFVAINADDFYGAAAYQVLGDYLSSMKDLMATDYAMVGYLLRNTLSDFGTVSRGVCHTEDGYLQHIDEITKIAKAGQGGLYTDDDGQTQQLSGDVVVSMNIWGFLPSIFDHLKALFIEFLQTQGNQPKSEFYIPVAVGQLIDAGKAQVRVLESHDPWFGVTYREDKAFVQESISQLIAAGSYPTHLWSHE